MNYWMRLSSLVLLFSFYLMQTVCLTTVVPLCGSNESAGNCTTAMVKTNLSPRAAPVKVATCKGEMEDFCWNGQCMYLVDLDEHYCRCDKGYTGTRCTHTELVKQPLSEEYLALTIFLTLLLLLAIAVALFFAYKWYKNKKLSQPIKEYKEVSTQNV
uniref:Proepiregulin n=1 Tax=Leptobrachium leishanense TaxID=445787 RepID=A0A8C5MYQ8_9ANUR